MNKKTDYYRECPQCSTKLYYSDKYNLKCEFIRVKL